MRQVQKFVAAVAGLACAASLAFAADQTILGKSLTVKQKPGDSASRKITGSGKEKGSSNTLNGNPTLAGSAGGALLEVFATGGTSTSQSFALLSGTSGVTGKPFWTGDSNKGFKYKDPKGENSPVTGVSIKRTPSGNFSIKAKISGKNGNVDVVPPNPGTSGCMALTLSNASVTPGDRYSVQFGPDSQIKNKADKLFSAKKPTLEGTCPTGPSTTTTTTIATTTTTVATTTTTIATTTTTIATTTTTIATTTTTVATTTTTSTTIYGSPSRAFLATPVDLLD